jgi:serine/threonine-protein kinase
MKRCPECRRDYYDDSLLYCLDDGSALLEGPASNSSPSDEPATAIMSATPFAEASATKRTVSPEASSKSIAVLPFAHLSSHSDDEFFCDGLAEELLNALSRVDGLKVAARTSSFFYKGKEVNLGEIGRALGIANVLEGSVRKSGDRLRITVQLISTSDGYHLWSERYDRKMKDIFDVQDEITLAVVEALKVKLLGDQQANVLKRYTDNTEAYELYLKGRYCFNKYTPEYFQKGIGYFEKAIEIEPEYAPAYASIGFCYGALFYFGSVDPHEIIPRWKGVVNRALEIDDALADAYLSLASIHCFFDRDFPQAERDYRNAIALNPKNPDAHWRYGHFLSALGRFDEAIVEGETAVDLDPLSLVVRFFMARILGVADRVDDAIEQVRNMIEMDPGLPGAHMVYGGLLMTKGMHEEAVAEYNISLDLGGFTGAVLSYLGAGYGAMGKRIEAHAVLDQLFEKRKEHYVMASAIARVYAGLGENDKAFEWFEKAIEERNGEMVFLKVETMAGLFGKSIGSDPRFHDILRSIGLSE